MTSSPFELTGPRPRGRVAIEASAGTGKTFTLAALAVREVVEAGVAINELLVVTFTRAAAAELRERIRRRLVAAEVVLRTGEADPNDQLGVHFLHTTNADGTTDGTPVSAEERARRLGRVQLAISDFDAATISTIHGFATQVLATLGSAAPGDPDAALVDDAADLITQATADVMSRAALILADASDTDDRSALASVLRDAVADDPDAERSTLLPSAAILGRAAAKVLGNPGIAVVPDADVAAVGAFAAVRRAMVDAVVEAVDRHRRDTGTLSFDEVLTQVNNALLGPDADRVRAALRRRFRVALIDEFQDTDPIQWAIFRTLFADEGEGDEPGALVLVGDPKQAIYAFRGANVHTYLEATTAPQVERQTLNTNWRSDGAVLEGLGALLEGVAFGHDDIRFQPVAAAPDHADRRISRGDRTPLPAVVIRSVTGPGIPRGRAAKNGKPGKPGAPIARQVVAEDLAEHLRRLLEDGWLPVEPDDEPRADRADQDGTSDPPRRRVRPDDIAVLVRNRNHADPVKAALEAHGIPVVVARGGSVAAAPAADQVRLLLQAVARPADAQRARALVLSWFYGWTPGELDAASDADIGAVHEQLHEWSLRLGTTNFAGFAAAVFADTDIVTKRLRGIEGDREVTDLHHLVELLHGATAGRPSSAANALAALDALSVRVDETERDVVERRVETDARAVQIHTMHGAKGLEFPIVCCPSMIETGVSTKADECVYQDPHTGLRTVDIAPDLSWDGTLTAKERLALAKAEDAGEGLRLAYVALTRARHQVITWWVNTRDSGGSPLAALLFGPRSEGNDDAPPLSAAKPKVPDDDAVLAHLEPLQAKSQMIAIEEVTGRPLPPATRWSPTSEHPPGLPKTVAVVPHALDRSRGRWSFTSISTHDQAARLDPYDTSDGDAGAGDEGGSTEAPPTEPEAAGPAPSQKQPAQDAGAHTDLPLGTVPGSAEFGTLVHSVLELVDFTADDLDAELDRHLTSVGSWGAWPVDQAVVHRGLRAAIETPLGPLFDGLALRQIHRSNPVERLDELAFELHLAADAPAVAVRDIGRLVQHHLPADDPLQPWASQVAAGRFPVDLAGHLTGSIDAVIRVPGTDGPHPYRYVVVDYKTNSLGTRGQPLMLADYHPDLLPDAMAHHHYPLQALLYGVALHRYLRWRVPAYRPEAHLGGAGYLFVRGMVGVDGPAPDGRPYGVFAWDVPPALTTDLSDLLAGKRVPQ